ncbi:CDP-diacylglycerol--glycerol-3-phosphate 3-phosphatidyltransferase, mitochondrial-like, partial [Scleropages formosus]
TRPQPVVFGRHGNPLTVCPLLHEFPGSGNVSGWLSRDLVISSLPGIPVLRCVRWVILTGGLAPVTHSSDQLGCPLLSFRSSVLLLAPLLAQTDPDALVSTWPPGSAGTEGLQARFRWMAELAPVFQVPGACVRVLRSPDEFYQVMKARVKTARRRVVMASLYLGTGPLEQDLVDCLQEALERSQSVDDPHDLTVSILLDYTRGSRGKQNSRTMLLPLLRCFPDRIRVALYHTPDLRGLLRLLVPQRFNETIGVQHIKVYLFDDSLIMSGANLSDSYFTNRQDRYVLLEGCRQVADFFAELVGAVSDVSLQLGPDDSVRTKEGMVHPYKGRSIAREERPLLALVLCTRCRSQHSTHWFCVLHSSRGEDHAQLPSDLPGWFSSPGDRNQFSDSARCRIMQVVDAAREQQLLQRGEPDGADTWVFPLVQMKPLGIRVDEQVTARLLTEADRDATVYLTSGYFNLTRAYMRLVLSASARYRILMASPEVNGFFGAKGLAGAIPAAYVHLARQFYSQVCRRGQQERVRLHEYQRRRDWTFHAKGLWYYLHGKDRPCLTLIGSPNFGYRSVHRDLEAQIAIVTENEALQEQLQQLRSQGTLIKLSPAEPHAQAECSTTGTQNPSRVKRGAGNAVPEVNRGVQFHVRATQSLCQTLGQAGHSTHQELLLSLFCNHGVNRRGLKVQMKVVLREHVLYTGRYQTFSLRSGRTGHFHKDDGHGRAFTIPPVWVSQHAPGKGTPEPIYTFLPTSAARVSSADRPNHLTLL